MSFYLSLDFYDGRSENITKLFKLPIAKPAELDDALEIERHKKIYLSDSEFESLHENKSVLMVNLMTELDTSFPMNFAFNPAALNEDLGVILAAIVLLGLYILIVWELVHRTFAAMIASTMAIGKNLMRQKIQLKFKLILLRNSRCNE